MITRYSFLVFFFIICQGLCYSQDPPMTWGEIPRADLEMKSFPQDSNASALVLCEYGESSINNDIEVVFKYHARKKILTPKGYDKGTVELVLYNGKEPARISDIEGVTYALDDKGQIISKELEKKDIFREKSADNFITYKFTLPGLAPGCIIEYRYTIIYPSLWSMPGWTFQGDEPVRWSEYRTSAPQMINYAAVTNGYTRFSVCDVEEGMQRAEGMLKSYVRRDLVATNKHRWVIQNAPAIREEPYITTLKDYYAKVDIQLNAYALYEGGVKNLLTSWEEFAKTLLEHDAFGEAIDNTRTMKKLTAQITEGLTSPYDKVKAIYNWTAKSIVCNKRDRIFAEKSVDDIVEEKKGSNAEITFVLLSLLKCAGIESYPVILSTRENGKIEDLYPIVSRFDHVIAAAKIDTQKYYLDPTNPLRPMELLPQSALNVKAMLLMPDKYEWLTLTSPYKYSTSAAADVVINDDGSVNCVISDTCRDYAALYIRGELKDTKEAELIKDHFDLEENLFSADSSAILNQDSIGIPLIINAKISSQSYAQKAGDIIYVNPQVLNRIKESPFKTKTRSFPIDFGHKCEFITSIKVNIPEGFEVKSKPGNREMNAAGESLGFIRKVTDEGKSIFITTRFLVKNIQIEPGYYERVKDFYTRVISALSEQIVLAKIQKAENK